MVPMILVQMFGSLGWITVARHHSLEVAASEIRRLRLAYRGLAFQMTVERNEYV
jgi:hypothetical protein